MPANRLPWVKVWIEALDHEKLAALNDSEFRTWVTMVAKASQQPKRWRFASIEHAAKVTGRKAKDIKRLVDVRLVDTTSEGVAIHDAKQWQEAANISPNHREHSLNGESTLTDPPPNGDGRLILRSPNGDLEGEGDREEDVERDKEPEEDDSPFDSPPLRRRGKQQGGTEVDQAFKDELEERFWEDFGSREAARDCIANALGYKKRGNYTDQRAFLRNWVRSEAEKAAARNHRPGKPKLRAIELPSIDLEKAPTGICADCGKERLLEHDGRICGMCGVERRKKPCVECGAVTLLWADTGRCYTCYGKRRKASA